MNGGGARLGDEHAYLPLVQCANLRFCAVSKDERCCPTAAGTEDEGQERKRSGVRHG